MNATKFFQEDHFWLKEQPNMNPWAEGCHRLWRHLNVWVKRYTSTVCTPPIEDSDAGFGKYRERNWRCWRFHWQPDLDHKDESIRKQRVANGPSVAVSLVKKKDGTSLLRDVTLAEAVTQADERALRLFVSEYTPSMLQLAKRTSEQFGDEAWSDVLDECFQADGQRGRLAGYNGQRPLRSYLATMVTREVYRYLRKHKRERPCPTPEDEQSPTVDLAGREKTPAEIVSAEEEERLIVDILREYIQQMDCIDRLILQYRYLNRKKYKIIGRIIGIHAGNVQKRLKSLLEHLPDGLHDLVRKRKQSAATAAAVKHLFLDLAAEDLGELLVRVLQDLETELERLHSGGDTV
jgi:RNA polymerase sigma factor (sigma-70 family)